MMKKWFALLIFVSLSNSLLYAADQQQFLWVTTPLGKGEFQVPFTARTTIFDIKQYIQEQEGIAPDHQVLCKPEVVPVDGILGYLLTDTQHITLDDDQTCQYYDIQPDSILKLLLLTQPHM
jgi:hypothetical protein